MGTYAPPQLTRAPPEGTFSIFSSLDSGTDMSIGRFPPLYHAKSKLRNKSKVNMALIGPQTLAKTRLWPRLSSEERLSETQRFCALQNAIQKCCGRLHDKDRDAMFGARRREARREPPSRRGDRATILREERNVLSAKAASTSKLRRTRAGSSPKKGGAAELKADATTESVSTATTSDSASVASSGVVDSIPDGWDVRQWYAARQALWLRWKKSSTIPTRSHSTMCGGYLHWNAPTPMPTHSPNLPLI